MTTCAAKIHEGPIQLYACVCIWFNGWTLKSREEVLCARGLKLTKAAYLDGLYIARAREVCVKRKYSMSLSAARAYDRRKNMMRVTSDVS